MIDIQKPRKNTAELRALWQEAFGDSDEFLDTFFRTAFSYDRCRTLTVNGELAAVLYWFDCTLCGEKIAYIYAVATAKKHQRKGLCRTLTENTHEHLKALGYSGAILVPASDRLFEFYERLGYKTCSYIEEFECTACDTAIDIQKIRLQEYALLRRTFLPETGVIQENENLDFLKTQAEFFKGDGFLLAARNTGDTLYGVELLGNTQATPEITAAFGCKSGKFRTLGGTRPFAMYHSLNGKDIPYPIHFGFVFD